MTQSKTIIAIVGAVAGLLILLAVGLLVRGMKKQGTAKEASPAAEPNLTAVTPDMRYFERRTVPTDDERADLQRKRQEVLKQMANASDQEKAQLRAKMREGIGLFDAEDGPKDRLSSEEMIALTERVKNMSRQEREAWAARMVERERVRQRVLRQDLERTERRPSQTDPNSKAQTVQKENSGD